MKLDLVLGADNSILRKKSVDIDFADLSFDLKKLSEDMIETMQKEKGVGLAAPQIGKNIRMIVIAPENKPIVMINPRISFTSKQTEVQNEGCLSLPGVDIKVERPKKIRYTYRDLNGNKIKGKAKGLFARVVQHEIDHLDGVLIVDKKYER